VQKNLPILGRIFENKAAIRQNIFVLFIFVFDAIELVADRAA